MYRMLVCKKDTTEQERKDLTAYLRKLGKFTGVFKRDERYCFVMSEFFEIEHHLSKLRCFGWFATVIPNKAIERFCHEVKGKFRRAEAHYDKADLVADLTFFLKPFGVEVTEEYQKEEEGDGSKSKSTNKRPKESE